MKLNPILKLFSILILTFSFGCSRSTQYSKRNNEEVKLRRPPATVEKAWLARHHYDPDRRLLIPRYSGARWGSILEYTEDENLVYRDWWVRDVKMEELKAEPSTKLVPFSQIESDTLEGQKSSSPEEPVSAEPESTEFEGIDDPFSNTESSDPFSPETSVPVENPAASDDPFAPF